MIVLHVFCQILRSCSVTYTEILSLAAGYVVCQASIASDPGRNRPEGWELAQEPQWEVC